MNMKLALAAAAAALCLVESASAEYSCASVVAVLKKGNGGTLPETIEDEGILKCVCKEFPEHGQCRPAAPPAAPQKMSCREGLSEYRAREPQIETLVRNPLQGGVANTSYPPGGWALKTQAQVDWYKQNKETLFARSDVCGQLRKIRDFESLLHAVVRECKEADEKHQKTLKSRLPAEQKKHHDLLELISFIESNASKLTRAAENLGALLKEDQRSCPDAG